MPSTWQANYFSLVQDKPMQDKLLQDKLTHDNLALGLEDLLAYEKAHPNQKVELVNGQIVPMAGTKGSHNIVANYFFMQIEPYLLKNGGRCFSYTSDVRVRISEHDYRYPDFLVDCSGQPVELYAQNPVLIGEILSQSTQKQDLTVKLEQYKSLASVQEVFIAYQHQKRVIVYTRKSIVPYLWTSKQYTDGFIEFKSIGLSVLIDDIYQRIKFDE